MGDRELTKCHLNLHAVLRNLEELVRLDGQAAALVRDRRISIGFRVVGGPRATVSFDKGTCRVTPESVRFPDVCLLFASPKHLNRMFDGKSSPIPLWGFTKLGFMTKHFTELTKRLEYYLKPTDELLKDQKYLEINTTLTIKTAVNAVEVLSQFDDLGKKVAAGIRNGILSIEIAGLGPMGYVEFQGGKARALKETKENIMGSMRFNNLKTANDILNNKADPFTAVAKGDVALKGHLGMIDSLNLILDRIPAYLS